MTVITELRFNVENLEPNSNASIRSTIVNGEEKAHLDLENQTQYSATTFRCDLEPQNPWCGQFGIQQYIEVGYLSIITLLGVMGNIVVIASILLEKKLHKQANIFIVNLALADFLVRIVYSCFNKKKYDLLYNKQ